MEIIKSIAIKIPMIIACVFLGIAAMRKMGKEKGAILVMIGAIGLIFIACSIPIVYRIIMPKMIEIIEVDKISDFYLAIQIIINLIQASAIALIAIGIFVRPTIKQSSLSI